MAQQEHDPFAHHPELRDQIVDPLQSFFRGFTTEILAEKARQWGGLVDWWHSDEAREALRAEALAGHPGGDLWVFAYGSLMWDPALRFAEVRRAYAPRHARKFILKSVHGSRGRPEAPGLMAALDDGPGCDGMAFRIAAERVAEETEILWRREQVGPAYRARFIEIVIDDEPIEALTFLADHAAPSIDAELTREDQIHFLATGEGFLGTSLDYLRGIHQKFETLGVQDAEVAELLQAAEAYRAALAPEAPPAEPDAE